MIGKLKGIVDCKGSDHLILDVRGVGYVIFCSGRTLRKLPSPGEAASVLIETHLREDAIKLYGFTSELDRYWFQTLLSVQGVGARTGLAIQTALEAGELANAILHGDKGAICQAPGIGPRLAARIITELKDKVAGGVAPVFAPADESGANKSEAANEALSALINLGYSRAQALSAVTASMAALGADAPVPELIRQGLKEITR
ncbi:MAG TPA: Holliday junction branch migration protein RuvA [Methylocella sp.]|nr:Holliday junction branch migration protein RuvA [Methylocella sp.]